ncbi:hypothetical protein [Brevundimonas sp. Root1279]|uniref:hypothetical protein n=1 Tax=Brevundimonas sp. Root1279 TaxID=1736443 RepID=UPI0006F9F950|nr:hypothetical protein [Brevundimonas sp. Root1279]KQW79750.1 hypothetical protein ASC65_14475 [Brevundimonas sp. Root1279]
MIAQGLIKHTARLRWVDAAGNEQSERHAAWSARRATEMAWGRAKSMKLSGEAKAFRIDHAERPVLSEDGLVLIAANDEFGIPPCAA